MNHLTDQKKSDEKLLEVRGLSKSFEIRTHLSRRLVGIVRAVDDVTFHVSRGETVGLVGESGCGKTTTGRCILRGVEPTTGQVSFQLGQRQVDVLALGRRDLQSFRRHMQIIFQDPYASLDARMTVMQIVAEPLTIHRIAKGQELTDRVRELIQQVGLDPKYLNRYPHAFSGGQRQRIGIARALALYPSLVVADEAVSALDMSMQAQILNLLKELQGRLKLTYLFIAHDLSVIRHFSNRVLVMYAGKLVEIGQTQALFAAPKHPYTEALLSAAPRVNPKDKSNRIILTGEVPDPVRRPPGCHFHPRCRFADDRCKQEVPALREVAPDRWSACHYAEQLDMSGIGEFGA